MTSSVGSRMAEIFELDDIVLADPQPVPLSPEIGELIRQALRRRDLAGAAELAKAAMGEPDTLITADPSLETGDFTHDHGQKGATDG